MRFFLTMTIMLGACGPPDCETVAGAPTCAQTVAAANVIDDAFAARGLDRVARFVDVEWIAGTTFLEDSRAKWGYTTPGVSDFKLCHIEVAARSYLPSHTSQVHESLHCSLFFTRPWTFGDEAHREPEWLEVPDINTILLTQGL